MAEVEVVCDACGALVVVRGLDGDGAPFTRDWCPECGAAVDVPDEADAYYPLSLEAR